MTMRPLRTLAALVALVGALAACDRRDQSPEAPPAAPVAQGLTMAADTTDSLVATMDGEAISRRASLEAFRKGLTEPTAYAGTSPSREELVQRFIRALETRDTLEIRAMVVSRAEYAWLWYPYDPQFFPPYALGIDLAWFQHETRSRKDLVKAWEELGGRPLNYRSHTCLEPRAQGPNRVHGYCRVTLAPEGKPVDYALFGLIVERDGQFKFVMYNNKL